jgi:antirestriction protein ArdC
VLSQCAIVVEVHYEKGEIMDKEKTNAYEVVAKTVIDALDRGVVPWRKPWNSGGSYHARSLSSKKNYRGINSFLLGTQAMMSGYSSPWWGTYKQIQELNGSVSKGSTGTPVVLWKMLEKTETVDGQLQKKTFPMMRYFVVFNAEQAEWLDGEPDYERPESRDIGSLDVAETIAQNYMNAYGIALKFGGDRAFYRWAEDAITLPARENFLSMDEFYSTYFHEIGHNTGHKNRLCREGVVQFDHFGSNRYAQEELVAEFTSAFLCNETGVLPSVVDNTAAYIASWRRALQDDPKVLVRAASAAQKAADLVLYGKEQEGE